MKILIISPTYNESENITSLVEQIFDVLDYHLLIVDDSSQTVLQIELLN